VEGISAYTLNSKGLITKHEIEVTSPTDYPFLEALRELLPVQRYSIFLNIGFLNVDIDNISFR
jgi:hypothetical protein